MTFTGRPEGGEGAGCETTTGNSILGRRTERTKALRQRFLGVVEEKGGKYD